MKEHIRARNDSAEISGYSSSFSGEYNRARSFPYLDNIHSFEVFQERHKGSQRGNMGSSIILHMHSSFNLE